MVCFELEQAFPCYGESPVRCSTDPVMIRMSVGAIRENQMEKRMGKEMETGIM